MGKLFSGGRYFLCRHCYSIAYGSQSEDSHDRLLRRANKLRMALGGEPGTANFIAWKPKGKWQRTYPAYKHGMRSQAHTAQRRAITELQRQLAALIK